MIVLRFSKINESYDLDDMTTFFWVQRLVAQQAVSVKIKKVLSYVESTAI
jgi:hypothetical protein